MLSVRDAAERLSVSVRQVQNLVASGELHQVARGLVDETSVERLRLVRGRSHRRAWARATSWGAVALLSGRTPDWMGPSQQARLRRRLRGLDAEGLVERARERASVTRFRAHPATVSRLRKEIVSTDDHAVTLGLAGTAGVDGYVDRQGLEGLVTRHGLLPDHGGPVTLRTTDFPLGIIEDLNTHSAALAALDLAESIDVRERRAGIDGLTRFLAAADA